MSKLALETTAVLTTFGTAAPVAATVSASGGSELPEFKRRRMRARDDLRRRRRTSNPVPTPLTYVSPAGSVSVTTTVLSSRCQPAAFATVNV